MRRLIAYLLFGLLNFRVTIAQGSSDEEELAETLGEWVLAEPIENPVGGGRTRGFRWESQIRCIGPIAEDLMLRHGQLAYPHPRSLCAKAIYGGNPVAFSVGGYCGPNNLFTIDNSIGDRNRIRFRSTAVMFCANRCRCINPDLPGDRSRSPPIEIELSEASPPAPYDKNPLNRTSPSAHEIVPQPDGPIGYYAVQQMPEPVFWGPNSPTRYPTLTRLLPNPQWSSPVCAGNALPRWQLPSPFITQDFRDLGSLCKAQVFGGSAEGNTGAVCQENQTGESTLKFMQYLAHPSFLKSHLPLGLAVQIWCERFCSCGGEPPLQISDSVEPLVMERAFGISKEAHFPKLGVSLYARTSAWNMNLGPGLQILELVQGTQASDGSYQYKSGVCGPDGPFDGCTIPWSDREFSSFAHKLGFRREERLQLSTTESSTPVLGGTCGEQCQSVKDCRASSSGDCTCVVNPTDDQIALLKANWLPRLPIIFGICAPLMRRSLERVSRGQPGKRDRILGPEDKELLCACNATYIANTCCSSLSGIVAQQYTLQEEIDIV